MIYQHRRIMLFDVYHVRRQVEKAHVGKRLIYITKTSRQLQCQWFNTLRPRQNGRHFADDTFNRIFVNENANISTEFSMKFVPKGPINSIPALVQIMAWCQSMSGRGAPDGEERNTFWKYIATKSSYLHTTVPIFTEYSSFERRAIHTIYLIYHALSNNIYIYICFNNFCNISCELKGYTMCFAIFPADIL